MSRSDPLEKFTLCGQPEPTPEQQPIIRAWIECFPQTWQLPQGFGRRGRRGHDVLERRRIAIGLAFDTFRQEQEGLVKPRTHIRFTRAVVNQ